MTRIPSELTAVAILLSITGGAALAVSVLSPMPNQASALPTLVPASPVHSPTPIPAIIPGPLDGMPTARGLALRRPIAAVIDNFSPDARPQSGLSRASLVYEAVTEAGVTRLLAVFLEHDAPSVGPIRSTRPYFNSWAAGLHSILVHDGGSPAALKMLRATRSLADADAISSGPFYRTQDRAAPHNLFTGTLAIRKLALRRGWTSQPLSPLAHTSAVGRRGTGASVYLDFSSPPASSSAAYAVAYRYDQARNRYLRFVGGAPAIDASTGRQIAVANVVVLVTRISAIPNDPLQRVNVVTLGSGRAFYLRDGRVIRGVWSKASTDDPVHFTDLHHHQFAFEPGATWVEVVTQGAVRFGK